MTAEIKAFLLSVGTADIEDLNLILPTRQSTAGPSAGSLDSVFVSSNGRRVRLTIDKNSPVKIRKKRKNNPADSNNNSDNELDIENVDVFFSNELILTGRIEPALSHCPDQAYVNLSGKCIFDCKYCCVPKLQGHTKSKTETLEIIENAAKSGRMKAISITSGVEKTPEKELNRVLELMPDLVSYNVPVGVSIYVVSGGSARLKKAGVSEVKYNIEAADSNIFKQVCPELSEADVYAELSEAAILFGKGKVYSNVIVGLGETDDNVKNVVEKLAKIGVITGIRPVFENSLRKGDCFMERPTQKRLLKLFDMQKKIYKKYDLHPEYSETMCSLCTGCDLVPFRDG
jgi:biotin synthase-related radical SAM superfamily protein